MSMRRLPLLVLLLGTPLLSGCGGGGGPAGPNAAQLLLILLGDGQTGPVGQTLPAQLVVRVTTDRGAPREGVEVVWGILIGGGSLGDAATRTAADGSARTTWTLGPTPGPQSVEAAVGIAEVIFTAVATTAQAALVNEEL